MMCFHVKGSGPAPGSGADTQDLDANEASLCSSETACKPRPRLILYPSINTSQHLVCLHPSALCSSRLSLLLSSRIFVCGAASPLHCCLPFSFRQCPAKRTPASHSSLAHSITGYPTKKKKKTHNLYSEARLRCEVAEGEEQPLLKSPFEDGLKPAPVDLAVRGLLFSLVGFVLQDVRFDLESSSRRRAQVRDARQRDVASSERSRAGRVRGHRPFPTCRRTQYA